MADYDVNILDERQVQVREHQRQRRQQLSQDTLSQRSVTRSSKGHKGWSGELETEYQQYRAAPRAIRQSIWDEWTKEERRLVYCVSNREYQAEQRQWKQRELEQQQKRFPSLSRWLRDLTKDGHSAKQPRCTRPMTPSVSRASTSRPRSRTSPSQRKLQFVKR